MACNAPWSRRGQQAQKEKGEEAHAGNLQNSSLMGVPTLLHRFHAIKMVECVTKLFLE